MTTTAPGSLDSFFTRVRTVNPFLANRVDRPLAQGLIDVAGIHEAAFRQVVALGQQAQEEDRGIGVLVWGEAGVGKSHLLARLAQQKPRGCFVYLHNLQADPERLPRYVLRCVLSVLSNAHVPPLSYCRLFHLLNAVLRKAIQAVGLSRPSWPQLASAYDRLLDRLGTRDPSRGVLFDRTVYDVFYRFYQAAYPTRQGKEDPVARLALRWLAGEGVDADEARLLGLPSDVPAGRADNQHIKQVLVALTRLARLAGQLFLLCFDQVDNLDEDQVQSLSRFLHDLLDSAGNLLVVTTGVRQTLLGFRQSGVITETSWDRLGQVEVLLNRIRKGAGRELLAARLGEFQGPFLDVAQVQEQVRQDALFPLGTDWFEMRVGHLTDYRPRDLLTWAGERWQGQQERLGNVGSQEWLRRWREGTVPHAPPTPPAPAEVTAAVDRAVAEKLAEEIDHRQRRPAELPPSEEQMQGLTYKILRRLGQLKIEKVPQPRYGPRPAYDLRVLRRACPAGREVCLGVRFLVAENATTMTAALRALDADDHPPDQVVLVTDVRQPLQLGKAGRRRLEQLQQRGAAFRHVELSFEDYAALDALQAVAEAARAGDLEAALPFGQSHRVSEPEVIDFCRGHGRYRAHPLLREFLGDEEQVMPMARSDAKGTLATVSDKEIREFLMAQVALEEGVALAGVAEVFADRLAARTGQAVDAGSCLPRLRAVAARMTVDGQLALNAEDECLTRARKQAGD